MSVRSPSSLRPFIDANTVPTAYRPRPSRAACYVTVTDAARHCRTSVRRTSAATTAFSRPGRSKHMISRWATDLNVEVRKCEDRPDHPTGDTVYRLIDLFTTHNGSWDPANRALPALRLHMYSVRSTINRPLAFTPRGPSPFRSPDGDRQKRRDDSLAHVNHSFVFGMAAGFTGPSPPDGWCPMSPASLRRSGSSSTGPGARSGCCRPRWAGRVLPRRWRPRRRTPARRAGGP